MAMLRTSRFRRREPHSPSVGEPDEGLGPFPAGRGDRSRDAHRRAGLVARYLGATSLLAVGAAHLQQYYVDYYSSIPTIGTLFLLTFVSATIVGLALMAPVERLRRRAGRLVLVLAALGGIGIATGALGGLVVSESVGLFGFMESGYREAILISIVLEALTVVCLSVYVIALVRMGALRKDSTGPPLSPDAPGAGFDRGRA
jgi:hypothetical protein